MGQQFGFNFRNITLGKIHNIILIFDTLIIYIILYYAYIVVF